MSGRASRAFSDFRFWALRAKKVLIIFSGRTSLAEDKQFYS
jgi:hypothetical protein